MQKEYQRSHNTETLHPIRFSGKKLSETQASGITNYRTDAPTLGGGHRDNRTRRTLHESYSWRETMTRTSNTAGIPRESTGICTDSGGVELFSSRDGMHSSGVRFVVRKKSAEENPAVMITPT
ncbi:hypothetical protein DM860_006735 [Cuscuta australis]|uniref:Uncharacterized protein n=1 Tax=Cuscuta australis TaxID=267555 RepID=A0A328D4N6_9ASTE|nr:hypothetical protein DM860_006735 [Cuscuta australis]